MSEKNHCLGRAQGDAWDTKETHDLFEKLLEHGVTVASFGTDGGWGHHSIDAVVRYKRKYYIVHAGGCSCEGAGTIDGPMKKREAMAKAGDLNLGDNEVIDG